MPTGAAQALRRFPQCAWWEICACAAVKGAVERVNVHLPMSICSGNNSSSLAVQLWFDTGPQDLGWLAVCEFGLSIRPSCLAAGVMVIVLLTTFCQL